ncbi:MAG TPA: hypothetical protein VEV20_03130 [Burkholderiales bacterium]|nr:hypothetical protein [Burkholderiales bacterium]
MDTELARTLPSVVAAGSFNGGRRSATTLRTDWGLIRPHSLASPTFTGAALTVNIGRLGLQHILSRCGSGSFPVRQMREHERASHPASRS